MDPSILLNVITINYLPDGILTDNGTPLRAIQIS